MFVSYFKTAVLQIWARVFKAVYFYTTFCLLKFKYEGVDFIDPSCALFFFLATTIIFLKIKQCRIVYNGPSIPFRIGNEFRQVTSIDQNTDSFLLNMFLLCWVCFCHLLRNVNVATGTCFQLSCHLPLLFIHCNDYCWPFAPCAANGSTVHIEGKQACFNAKELKVISDCKYNIP